MIPAINDQPRQPVPTAPLVDATVDADFVNGIYEALGSPVTLADVTDYDSGKVYAGIGLVFYASLYNYEDEVFDPNPAAALLNDLLDTLLTGNFTVALEWHSSIFNSCEPLYVSDGADNRMAVQDGTEDYFNVFDQLTVDLDPRIRQITQSGGLSQGIHGVAITRTDEVIYRSIDGNVVEVAIADQHSFTAGGMTSAWLGGQEDVAGATVIGRIRIYSTPITDFATLKYLAIPSVLTSPSNDSFVNAQSISLDETLTGRTFCATVQTGEPEGEYNDVYSSAWWSFEAPDTETYAISLNGSDLQGAGRVGWIIDVFTGTDFDDLTLIASSTDWPAAPTLDLDATIGVIYYIRIQGNGSGEGLIEIIVANPSADVTPPTITSSNEAEAISGSTLSHALTADETVTWTITGGVDAAEFEISGSTLRWVSNGTRSIGSPQDDDVNNVYQVTIEAEDTAGNTTPQNVSVFITDASGWFVAFVMPTPNVNYGSFGNQNTRQRIDTNLLRGGAQVRVTFISSLTQQLKVLTASMGRRAVSGNTYDYAGDQIAMTFNTGSAGFTAASGGNEQTSDAISYPVAKTDNLVIALLHDNATSGMRGHSGVTGDNLFEKNTAVDETMITDVTMSFRDNGVFGISKIEVKQ